jgi:photosystem II stability/assembly factor-like uncharacterized protein
MLDSPIAGLRERKGMRRNLRPGKRILCVGLVGVLGCSCIFGLDSFAEESDSVRVDVNLFASAVLSEGRSIMVGDRGKIFLSAQGRTTWKLVESRTKRALAAICFPNDRHGWVAGQSGVILHSEDGGTTWETQSSGVDTYLLNIDFIDPDHGFAVGADSTVVVTTDGGKVWKNASLNLSLDLDEEINVFAVTVMEPHKACIAGDRGRIFTTEDGGESWVESKSPLYDEEMMEGRILYSMAYDSDALYAVGIDGAFISSRDQGKTWAEHDTGFPGPELYCIDVVDGTGLAAGSGGHIFRTSDGGATWSEVEVPEEITRSWLSGVDLHRSLSGDVYGLIVGQDGTFGLLRNGAFSW